MRRPGGPSPDYCATDPNFLELEWVASHDAAVEFARETARDELRDQLTDALDRTAREVARARNRELRDVERRANTSRRALLAIASGLKGRRSAKARQVLEAVATGLKIAGTVARVAERVEAASDGSAPRHARPPTKAECSRAADCDAGSMCVQGSCVH